MRYTWISCTTDYGRADGFVAACHGVLATLAPEARVLDVTHDVPAQAVRHGGEVLAQTVPYLPEAVHLAVVDPGVGTTRRGVAVVAERGVLVGPDNGLLAPAADALGGVRAAYELTEPAYQLDQVSATFHGRDVFAPAAAHLALGVPACRFGRHVEDLVRLRPPTLRIQHREITAEVITVDGFGNVQLAGRIADLDAAGISGTATIHSGRYAVRAVVASTFADVPAGEAVLHADSAGQLAVAINRGSVARRLGLPESGAGYSSESPQELTITSSPTDSLP